MDEKELAEVKVFQRIHEARLGYVDFSVEDVLESLAFENRMYEEEALPALKRSEDSNGIPQVSVKFGKPTQNNTFIFSLLRMIPLGGCTLTKFLNEISSGAFQDSLVNQIDEIRTLLTTWNVKIGDLALLDAIAIKVGVKMECLRIILRAMCSPASQIVQRICISMHPEWYLNDVIAQQVLQFHEERIGKRDLSVSSSCNGISICSNNTVLQLTDGCETLTHLHDVEKGKLVYCTSENLVLSHRVSRDFLKIQKLPSAEEAVMRLADKNTLHCCSDGESIAFVAVRERPPCCSFLCRSLAKLSTETFDQHDFVSLERPSLAKSTTKGLLFTSSNPLTIGKFRLKQDNAPFTVELWMFATSVSEVQSLFSHGEKSIEEVLLEVLPVAEGGSIIRGGCRSPQQGSTFVLCEVPGSSLLRRWTHIALTFSGVTWKLYINGSLVSNTKMRKGFSPGVDESACSLGKGFLGHLLEVRVWSTARSEVEIQRDMSRLVDGNESRLDGCFSLCDDCGILLQDRSKSQGHTVMASVTHSFVELPSPPLNCNSRRSCVGDILPGILGRLYEPMCALSKDYLAIGFSMSDSVTVVLEYSRPCGVLERQSRIFTARQTLQIVYHRNVLQLISIDGPNLCLQKLPFMRKRWRCGGNWNNVWDAGRGVLQGACNSIESFDEELPWMLDEDLPPLLIDMGRQSVKLQDPITTECVEQLLSHMAQRGLLSESNLFEKHSDSAHLLASVYQIAHTGLRDESTGREVLEWLAFHARTGVLLSALLPLILTEKATLGAVVKLASRVRSLFEQSLFVASCECLTKSTSLRSISSRSDRLLQLCTALLSEAAFDCQQCVAQLSSPSRSCVEGLGRLQSWMLDQAVESPSALLFGVVTSYCNQLLKLSEKAFLKATQSVRKGILAASVEDALRQGFVGFLLPKFVTVIERLPPSIHTNLVSPLSSCRDALASVVNVCQSNDWLKDLQRTLLLSLAVVSCRLLCSGTRIVGLVRTPKIDDEFQILFRNGFRKSGVPRDAFVRNLLQGVGVVSRIVSEIQTEDMPLRTGDTAFLGLERTLIACFANALFDNQAVTSPSKELLQSIYKHVKALRSWILSKRQEDSSAIERIELRAVFLCKFEPPFLTSRTLQLSELQPSANPTKKWRRMFQAWKVMRNVRTLLSVVSAKPKTNRLDVASVIARFLQSAAPQPSDVERVLQMKASECLHRIAGCTTLKGLIEVGRTLSIVDEVVTPVVTKSLSGWHYLHNVEGCSGESLSRLRSVFFQLLEEVLTRMELSSNNFLSSIFLTIMATPWQRGDYRRIGPSILSNLGRICLEGKKDTQFGQQVMNHDVLPEMWIPLTQQNCGGSLVVCSETSCLKGSGSRGAFVSPLGWCRTKGSTNYFEITIVDLSASGSIAIGLGPSTFAYTRPPGWDLGSYALHSDDGTLFVESSNGRATGHNLRTGDTVGCGWKKSGEIYWTRNGKLINVSVDAQVETLHPIVGLDGIGIVFVNFGQRSMEYSPTQTRSAVKMSRKLHNRGFDVLRTIAFRAVSCAAIKDDDEAPQGQERHMSGVIADGSNDMVRFLQTFFSLIKTMLNSCPGASEAFSSSICGFLISFSEALRQSGTCLSLDDGDALVDELNRVGARPHCSKRLRSMVLQGIAAVLQFVPISPRDNLSTIFKFALGESAEHEGEWTDETTLTAITVLHSMVMTGHTWSLAVESHILQVLEAPECTRRNAKVVLAILGGGEMHPVVGNTVFVRHGGKDEQLATLVALNLKDEVCEVIISTTKKRHIVSLRSLGRIVDAMDDSKTFTVELKSRLEGYANTICKMIHSRPLFALDAESCTSLQLHASVARLLWRYRRLNICNDPFDGALNKTISAWISLPRSSASCEKTLRILNMEDCVLGSFSLGQRRTDFAQDADTTGGSTYQSTGQFASDSVDEARTRMAQELSMRGFSLEMCMIALEETHYDRSAALRLLTEHHEDLLHVLHQEEDEMSEEEAATEEEEAGEGTEDEEDEDAEEESEQSTSRCSSASRVSQDAHEGIHFDGSSMLKITTEVSVGPQFTIDFWIRPQSIEDQQVLVFQRGSAQDIALYVTIGWSILRFAWGRIDAPPDVQSGVCSMPLTDSDPSRWTRITCVQDCADLLLYKNGILKDTAVASCAESLLGSELCIAGCSDRTQCGFAGDMKDIRIFETALTHEVVESMFTLTQSPTPTATNPHLVIHFRCDEGQFPMENASVSANSIAVTTTTVGSVVWLQSETALPEGSGDPTTLTEVDFSTQCDFDEPSSLEVSPDGHTLLACRKQYQGSTFQERRVAHISVLKEILVSYGCRMVLSEAQQTASLPNEWSVALTKAVVGHAMRSEDKDASRQLLQLFTSQPCGTMSSSLASFLDAGLAHLLSMLQHPHKVLTFESTHPCKGVTENPKEVSISNQSTYTIYFDQRCSAGAMLLTIYADQTLSTVIGQYSGSTVSTTRIRGSRFYFDVRLDGSAAPQWGYKLYIVCDDQPQLRAARTIRMITTHYLRRWNTVPPLFVQPESLHALSVAAVVSIGKCRRLVISVATDVLRFSVPSICHITEAMRQQDIRKMAEKQFRREMGMHLHSRFVQTVTQYSIAVKDVENGFGEGLAPDGGDDDEELSRFMRKRSEQKKYYSSKYREGKDRVGVEKLRFPDHIRIEPNVDKTVAVWSERTGCSLIADVALSAGKWYYEVRMVATADVTLGVLSATAERGRAFTLLSESTRSCWGFNGRQSTTTGIQPGDQDSSTIDATQRRWRSKDVIGVVVDAEQKLIEYHCNGVLSHSMRYGSLPPDTAMWLEGRAASAAGIYSSGSTTVSSSAMSTQTGSRRQVVPNTDWYDNCNSCGVFPFFELAADEGIVINFGVTHFEYDVPAGSLPLDPSHLSLGTLIPFNQVRAFEDVMSTFATGGRDLPPYFVDEVDPFENPTQRSGPPHVSLSGDQDIFINILEAKNQGNHFRTVRGDCIVTAGRWYFEATLSTQGLMQIGWLSTLDGPEVTVGDSPLSWSIDGFRRLRWSHGTSFPVSAGRRWVCGDVVGCGIDIDHRRVVFFLNGRQISESYMDLKPHHETVGFIPAASLRSGNALMFNFGSSHLKFKPDNYSALGVPDTWHERIDTYYSTLSASGNRRRCTRCIAGFKAILDTAMTTTTLSTGSDDVTVMTGTPPPLDHSDIAAVVVAVDQCCKSTNRTFLQLSLETVRSVANSVVEQGWSISECFEFLKAFARIAEASIPLLHVSGAERNIGLSLVSRSRRFLFASVREQLVTMLLKETSSRTEQFRLTVNRLKARGAHCDVQDTVFGQTFDLLQDQGARMFKTSRRMWSVLFLGEGAEDVGGPYREHFGEMCRELMSAALPLFIPTQNHTNNAGTHRDAYTPNPDARDALHMSMYVFLGRLMGGAMRGAEPLNLTFPPLFWRLLLDEPVSEFDLDGTDRMCLQCIRELRDMRSKYGEEGRELFDETFETETFSVLATGGSLIELKEDGKNIRLTFDNCDEYVRLLTHARLFEARDQIAKIREGLLSVIPETALAILAPEEVSIKICGSPDYTVQALKESTLYEGVTSEDRRVTYLWQALESATAQQRRLFLKFVSGRERMPVQLRVLPMVTQGDPNTMLPRAATCFFAIELPDYSTVDVLREKLFYAIENCLDIDTDFRARDVDDGDGPQLMIGVESRHDDANDAEPQTE